jgi:EAL domain-containing protein (putative c-di-GMP-specific phosphodiesterase class I)
MQEKFYQPLDCQRCANNKELDFPIEFAFQPIVNTTTRQIESYEALVRGPNGEGAATIFAQVTPENLYRFDQTCRTKAIMTAAKLGLDTFLNINFTPNAVYKPELCIRTTLEAAKQCGFSTDKIIFEVTEGEEVEDRAHLVHIFQSYKKMGFYTAIDDFGAGYSGLNLLTEYQPDLIKLDRQLIQDADKIRSKQIILKGIKYVSDELNIRLLAEGVETKEEYLWLKELGVELYQGYYFARPGFFNASPGRSIAFLN